MDPAIEKEGDSPSSTDDDDKTEPDPIKLLCLLRFGDRTREVSGHYGMGLEDLLALAEQTFADVPRTSLCKFRLQYLNERWKDWVDIRQDFIMESDLQIRILNDTQDSEVDVNLPETKKRNLLDRLKEIRKKPRSHSKMPSGNAEVKINLGWKHFHRKSRSYQQVKSAHGGGTVTVKIPRNASYDDVMGRGKSCFFPNGSSSKGMARRMRFSLGNFQGHEMSAESFSLEDVYDMYGCKTRIYLFSREEGKKKSEVIDVDDDTDSSELTDPGLRDILDEATGFIPSLPPFQLRSIYPQPLPSTSQPLPSTSQPLLSTSQSLPSTAQPLPSTAQPLPSTPQPLPTTSKLLLPTSQLLSPPSQVSSVATTVASVFVEAGTPTVSIKKTACGICCDRPKNAFLLPCGHAFCMPCATHFMANDLHCPYCKVQPIQVGTIFD